MLVALRGSCPVTHCYSQAIWCVTLVSHTSICGASHRSRRTSVNTLLEELLLRFFVPFSLFILLSMCVFACFWWVQAAVN